MKKGFTLIELILSMVIIAIAFTVLPKILQLATKVSTQSVREESMYNAIALIGLIQATAWDENNTEVDDILHVVDGDGNYTCGDDTYRIGGFTGSRNCKNDKNASSLGSDDDDNGSDDDMDDFSSVGAKNYNNSREYNLSVSVDYVEDISMDNESAFSTTLKSDTTNTKYIKVEDKTKKKQSTLRKTIATFYFHAMNIGQIQVNKRAW
jgi:prepilin-type N-terminal cleavage/methylation domain-containing protein